MADVRLVHVTKIFNHSVVAVKDLNLDVRDGEFVVLLGPSGCGKTTTLRMIAGLEKPSEGEIYIGGELVNEVPPQKRDIAMVFQSYALYPHMKVFDNIAFPLKMRKVPKEEIRKRVREVAEMLNIAHLLDRKPKQLSGGERQRVALARAIVRKPRVFLMDEPLSNLDAKLRVKMRIELKALQRELGVTTVYVTHDQVEAMVLADRVAILRDGELQQYASPSEVYVRPSNVFVAGFVGSPPMNFIEGTLKATDSGAVVDTGDFTIELHPSVREALGEAVNDGLEVIYGVRPEHVLLAEEASRGTLRGVVKGVEPLGSDTIVHTELPGGKIVVIKRPGSLRVSPGQEILLSLSVPEAHVFDKRTEKALL